jgi:hypothetical protein
MTIYEKPIPKADEETVLQILEEERGERSHYPPNYTRYLCELYITYIRPDKIKGGNYEHSLNNFKSCPRCISQAWEYFRKKYNYE